jgi:hypothetical protein
MDAEGREHRVLASNSRFNGVIAKDITLRNAKICMGDMELCGIAHECGDEVTLREGLFDELATGPTGSTKDEEFHEAGVSVADSTLTEADYFKLYLDGCGVGGGVTKNYRGC